MSDNKSRFSYCLLEILTHPVSISPSRLSICKSWLETRSVIFDINLCRIKEIASKSKIWFQSPSFPWCLFVFLHHHSYSTQGKARHIEFVIPRLSLKFNYSVEQWLLIATFEIVWNIWPRNMFIVIYSYYWNKLRPYLLSSWKWIFDKLQTYFGFILVKRYDFIAHIL